MHLNRTGAGRVTTDIKFLLRTSDAVTTPPNRAPATPSVVTSTPVR